MFAPAGLPLNPFDRDPPPKDGLPVAGGRFPKLGHLPAMAWNLPGLCRWVGERYGSHVWLDRGFGSEILQITGEPGFALFKSRDVASSALYEVAATFVGRSMIVMDGADHRRVRGATAHAFSPQGLDRAAVGRTIAEVVDARVARWSTDRTLGIAREARELALEIIFRIVGIEASDLPRWRHQFEELALSAINLPIDLPGSPQRRGLKAAAWLDEHTQAIVDRAREQGDRESLVGGMVHGRDEREAGLSDRELIDNLKLLVLAGHETTASVLAWAFLHLAAEPRAWARLVDEAETLGRTPQAAADLEKVPFAVGVFREALRLYPPVTSTIRVATQDAHVAGVDVREGTILSVDIHALSRSPERYPGPDVFRPWRWIEHGRRPTQIEMVQFGGGAHFCLGYHVALLEGAATLVAAARHASRRDRRPALLGAIPRPVFLPVVHPPRASRVGWVDA